MLDKKEIISDYGKNGGSRTKAGKNKIVENGCLWPIKQIGIESPERPWQNNRRTANHESSQSGQLYKISGIRRWIDAVNLKDKR